MAVAAEALEAGAEGAEGGAESSTSPGGVWQAVSRASGHLRRAPGAAAGGARASYGGYQRHLSTPSAAAQTITKLVWAIAIGLIALEIAAQATGQTWSFALGGAPSGQKPQKGAYLPLYSGQPAANTTVTAAMPGVLPNTVGNTAPVAGAVLGFVP